MMEMPAGELNTKRELNTSIVFPIYSLVGCRATRQSFW